MVLAEIPERKTIQVPPVGRIAIRAEIRIVRRDDHGPAAWREESVELFHCPDDIGDVFDYMDGPDFTE